jgi:1-acyl-sn-glycerol-3-phosphate acyltransferase
MDKQPKAKATLTFKMLRILLQLILKTLFKIEITDAHGNKAKFPEKGGYILAANHLHWLDPFLFLAFAPAQPRIYFIADKRSMVHNKFRSFMTGQIGGVIHVDLSKNSTSMHELKEKVGEVLAGGGVLGIFPEGQVQILETGQLLPFKKGLGYFAMESHAPILPVAISGTKELYFRKRIKVVVGDLLDTAPLMTSGKGKIGAEVITNTTRDEIAAIIPDFEPFDPTRRKFLRTWLTELFNLNPVPNLVRMEQAYRETQKPAEKPEALAKVSCSTTP